MNANQPLDELAARGIAETLHLESRHYAAPIWWGTDPYDADTVLHAASCFFVEVGDSRFGVTAFHVIAKYLSDRAEHQRLRPLASTPENWPLPPPQPDRGVVFTGYPGTDRRVVGKNRVEFLQSSNLVVVRAVSEDDVEVTVDPAFLKSLDGRPIPPTTKNLGGYSGSPLLVVSAKPLSSLFWLGGVVIRQLPAKDENDTTTIWARRPNCIRPDGTLIS
jgi:hypothetical protein